VGGAREIERPSHDILVTLEYVPLRHTFKLPVVEPAVRLTQMPVEVFMEANVELSFQLNVVDLVRVCPLLPSALAARCTYVPGDRDIGPVGAMATEESETAALTLTSAQVPIVFEL
jgi:hypothetical protein